MNTFAIVLISIAATTFVAWPTVSLIALKGHSSKHVWHSYRRRLKKFLWLLEIAIVSGVLALTIATVFGG